ncbi:MAG TPA: asparagine synthetase B [Saprospiraceae bacterium]|nr:asparagine synthetase B [Saprospiraceae bacterium]
MLKRRLILLVLMAMLGVQAQAAYILLPMDAKGQRNHLKAYGITYWVLQNGVEAWWLLNYRGGSFAFAHSKALEKECITRGVSYEVIPDAQFALIRNQIADQEVNMDAIKLEVAPKIAVYTPDTNEKGERIQPWDDAVTLALTYAEIPYETIYDREVLEDALAKYDWLHLHHEDFTGQYGRFYRSYSGQPWYREHVRRSEELANAMGFGKVSQLKLAVVKKIREFVIGGGFMFAMCSATDTYDIALAAEGVDICAKEYDGDAMDPNAQLKLNFANTLAFRNFELMMNPFEYEHSTIDNNYDRNVPVDQDYFTLFDFSAKWDVVPTMLTQCHTRTVKGFMGQTTAFRKQYIKPSVLILGENKPANEARYIHGTLGEGTWTFYGGHDPEDYRHFVHDPPTDLSLHPNSPGYRLILNNILFPAAKKKQRKT